MRASAERGRVQGPGRAEADLGPRTVTGNPVVLRAPVNGVEDAQLRRRPAPGEWAIIEVVGHLADTEERALARVRRMLAEENPELAPFDQEALAEEPTRARTKAATATQRPGRAARRVV